MIRLNKLLKAQNESGKKNFMRLSKMGCRPEMKGVTRKTPSSSEKRNLISKGERRRPLNCQFWLSVSPKAMRYERKTIPSCEWHESLETCYQLRLQIVLKGHKNLSLMFQI